MSEKTKNIYSLPVPRSSITKIVKDNLSYQGPFKGAVDLAVPLDTLVWAAADGIVVKLKDDSVEHGSSKEYGSEVNYVTIKHQNGEFSEYLHLAKGSVVVKAGEKVQRGQEIGKTGLSGWMTAPHLHFIVYKLTDDEHGFKGLEVQFDNTL